MKLRLTARAHRDLESQLTFIQSKSPAGARRVLQRIESTFRLIQTSPKIGRHSARPGTLEFPVPGLPFLIVYRVQADTVEVLTVFHTSQDVDRKY